MFNILSQYIIGIIPYNKKCIGITPPSFMIYTEDLYGRGGGVNNASTVLFSRDSALSIYIICLLKTCF